jgi:hypothetical protein
MGKVEKRMKWLEEWASNHKGMLELTSEDMQEAFLEAFPETISGLPKTYYNLFGYTPNRYVASAARQAYKWGIFQRRYTIGNQDARSDGKSTYAVFYSID